MKKQADAEFNSFITSLITDSAGIILFQDAAYLGGQETQRSYSFP
jgi:hypothetical protein